MIKQTIEYEHIRSGRSISTEHLEELTQNEYMRVMQMRQRVDAQGTKFKVKLVPVKI